jgi:hypothetical protein
MATLIKKLFFKTTLSDDEILEQWNNSNKSPQDFIRFINSLSKLNQDKYLHHQIENVHIKSFIEAENIIGFLKKIIEERK